MTEPEMIEHRDVVIVGAGLSGIGAAHHLQAAFPAKTYAILEARDAIGGTWDLFRYPGVRSDSDMFTLGYRFRPWTEAKAIADGPSILGYVRATAAEAGIERHIRFGHRVTRAAWSSERARWTVEATLPGGETVTLTCNFLLMCSGYYRYDQGYQAELPGIGNFGGQVVHPQFWPTDLDYAGKRVVVIGSGATAVTLVPALAQTAEHVTMLQRSPTYILSLPARGRHRRPAAQAARRAARVRGHPVEERRGDDADLQARLCRADRIRGWIRQMAVKQLPDGYDVDTHFKPVYNPWDQRLCLVPDGDLFAAIRDGRASVATDRVEAFTESGEGLRSGAELGADIVVDRDRPAAARAGRRRAHRRRPCGPAARDDGLQGHDAQRRAELRLHHRLHQRVLDAEGGPGERVRPAGCSGTWTIVATTPACRSTTTRPSPRSRCSTSRPGTCPRSIDQFPRAGSRPPWRLGQSYAHDVVTLRHGKIDDGSMRFSRAVSSRAGRNPARSAVI